MSPIRLASIACLCAAMAACGTTPSSSKVDYKKAVVLPPLDIPPALNVPATGPDGMELPAASASSSATLLPQVGGVRVERDGEMRWLVVQGSAESLWPRVHEFWTREGIEIRNEDARTGLIVTQWAENQGDIPDSFLRRLISKAVPALYSASTRDRYRMRLERGAEPGTTEIYLSHFGAEHVNRGEQVVWQPRPSDPELVAHMLSRLMLFLGVSPEQAQAELAKPADAPARARLEGDRVVLDEGFARAWRLTGIALDRAGLVVEDLDRAKGVYFVRQTDGFGDKAEVKKSWFSSGEEEEKRFRVVVEGDENVSRLSALDEKGNPLPAGVAKPMLESLQKQLR